MEFNLGNKYPIILKMLLKIACANSDVENLYRSHSSYYDGDSGLDLFCVEDVVIGPGESNVVNLGIRAAGYSAKGNPTSFWITPRSSISKTPLRLSNSGMIGFLRFKINQSG